LHNKARNTRKHKGVIIILLFILVSLNGINFVEAVDLNDPNFFCNFTRELYPDLQWKPLKKGDRLGTYDAILTCTDGTVTIKSNLVFNPYIKWEEKDREYLGRIPAEMHVVISTQSREKAQPNIVVEAIEVSGEVIYSTDRNLIEKYGSIGSKPRESHEEIERKDRQQYDDLKTIGWEPLTIDRQLGPWDMIWTQENGRIEIEILKEGVTAIDDESTVVKDPKGHFTHKNRFPQNSYFIMDPEFYLKAKVNKIIGNVWVATDREKVKEFDAKYRTLVNLGPMDREADLQWRETLKKEKLE